MVLLFSPSGFFAFSVFLAAAAAFALAIRFFVDSRRRLGELFPDLVSSHKLQPSGIGLSGFLLPEKTPKKTTTLALPFQKPLRTIEPAAVKEEIKTLRLQLQELNEVVKQIIPFEWRQAKDSQLEPEETLLEKEERLQELVQENHQLHELLNDLQQKHAQSTLQQQQLLKKITFLEVINADMQQAAEANKKLKAKMSRVAELESMIELMTGGK